MPAPYFDRLKKLVPDLPAATAFPRLRTLWDLEARLRLLDQFGDYQQVLSLANPPIELLPSPAQTADYARMANLGAMLSGQLGAQGHYANGLAAFYIATGQEAACVSESAIGFTRMERRGDDLFVSVTLPNLLVGSVAQAVGGKGGGRPDLAEAGGKDAAALPAALEAVYANVQGMLK